MLDIGPSIYSLFILVLLTIIQAASCLSKGRFPAPTVVRLEDYWGILGISSCSPIKHARGGSIMGDPERRGLVSIVAKDTLELIPNLGTPFPVNVDGGTLMAKKTMLFKRVGQIPLIANAITGATL